MSEEQQQNPLEESHTNWTRIYLVVVGVMALLIFAFYVITSYYKI